jgi:hypothetical protein
MTLSREDIARLEARKAEMRRGLTEKYPALMGILAGLGVLIVFTGALLALRYFWP